MPGCRTWQEVGPVAVINRDSPQAHGLVGWAANIPPSGSGGVSICDASRRFSATARSTAKVTHPSGRSLVRFNGSDTLINASAVPWSAALPITLSCWLVVRESAAYEYKIMASGYSGSESSILTIAKDPSEYLYYYEDGAAKTTTNPLTTLGTLRHYCLALTATTADMYIDGVSVGIAQPTGSFSGLGSAVFRVGSLTDVLAPDTGDGCDYRVYNRRLSAAEAWSLYDPRTRYDLYWRKSRSVVVASAAAPAGDAVPQVWSQYRRRHAG